MYGWLAILFQILSVEILKYTSQRRPSRFRFGTHKAAETPAVAVILVVERMQSSTAEFQPRHGSPTRG
jgi:hypothetical protein